MTSGESFYITTPIYYPSDVPHIGHGYTTVAVDALARWHRQGGDDTWMLTGTDEHGQKMLRAAAANGATPQEWVDRLVAESWHPVLETLDVANDDFIRTTQPRHEERVQKFVQAIYDRGYIYAGEFEALYCVGCEEFKTESEIVDGAPVLSEGGALAGRVTGVGEGWAEVTLINDTSSLVAGRDNRTNASGNVVGRLAAPLAMEEIPRTDQVSINDRIVTLGASIGRRFRSVYPKGIPIGRVVDVLEVPGDVVKTALIQPDADLDHLEYVLVLKQGEFTPPRPIADPEDVAAEG